MIPVMTVAMIMNEAVVRMIPVVSSILRFRYEIRVKMMIPFFVSVIRGKDESEEKVSINMLIRCIMRTKMLKDTPEITHSLLSR